VPAPEKDLPPATPLSSAPAPSGGGAAAKNAQASPAEKSKPPVAPGAEEPFELPPPAPLPGETSRRDSQRPVLPAVPYLRSASKRNLNVLEGKVIANQTGQPERGVTLTFANQLRTFADRVVVTDASGLYKVRLPDGDWTVNVAMPSGSSYSVSQLVVSRGQITDDAGRDIPTLIINR
jgi:hypothetical protein